MTWTRTPEGYACPAIRAAVYDNGNGYGPSAGSGRWAVEVAGEWIKNVDTLADAKALALEVAGA